MKPLGKKMVGLYLSLLCVAACGGNVSNPTDPGNLDGDAAAVQVRILGINPSLPALTVADGGGSSWDLTNAWLVVNKIEFHLSDGAKCDDLSFDLDPDVLCESDDDSDEDEMVLSGPFYINLLTGESFPSLDGLTLPSGTLREVEIKIDAPENNPAVPAGVPTELANHSLLLEGSIALLDGPQDFYLLLAADEEVHFKNTEGLVLSEALSVNELLLSLDVQSWLRNVDIQSCVDQENITIEEDVLILTKDSTFDECEGLDEDIEEAIDESGELDREDELHDDSSADDSKGELS